MLSIRKKFYLLILMLGTLATPAFADNGTYSMEVVEKTSHLVFQLGVILFAVWAGRILFHKLRLPVVLGEILAGVVIGPYCLGQIALPGFEQGLFSLSHNFPVSIELYSLAAIAAIILLFFVGLETDIETFIKFSFTGSVIGIFGVIFSFFAGDFAGILICKFLWGKDVGLLSPVPLFMGVITTATSVGITARILSEKRKMNSPEGVSILAAAVIDDVLGIILLAVVVGMARSGHLGVSGVSVIALRSIFIWLIFTALGLLYANKISNLLKKAGDRTTMALLGFGLALLLSGVFERCGLAMIIGAYVMGLSLSKTDLSFIIQERLDILQKFFVPIFFCVMGMLINLKQMISGPILLFGFIYVVFAVLGKVLGCSIPALFLNFNMRGAARIGVGMVPRGEVALIIAGIGLSTGIIGDEVFSIVMIMMFVTTLMTPPVLDRLFSSEKSGLKKEQIVKKEQISIKFDMPNPETADLLLGRVIAAFENEGFFVYRMSLPQRLYQIRKDEVFMVMRYSPTEIEFDCLSHEAPFVHTLFYEVLAEMEKIMRNLQTLTDKSQIGKKIFEVKDDKNTVMGEHHNRFSIPSSLAVEVQLKGNTKEEILNELVDLLVGSRQLEESKKTQVLKDLFDRESMMSTGMQDGIALPHAKSDAINKVMVATGVKKEGMDFDSLDKNPSNIFILIVASKKNPHEYLQSISEISRYLASEENRQKVLSCETNAALFEALNLDF